MTARSNRSTLIDKRRRPIAGLESAIPMCVVAPAVVEGRSMGLIRFIERLFHLVVLAFPNEPLWFVRFSASATTVGTIPDRLPLIA